MNQYDFKTLSPIEFELLVQDLLQKEFNIRLESFKSGKDNGVDLRYCQDKAETLVIQCKRYSDNFSSLFTTLKNEVNKVEKLKPKRYILVASTKLSRDNKNKIIELFNGLIKQPKDIYGCEDLNALLRDYPEIEKKHFKLWLSSINIVEKILHNNVHNRSYYKIEEIKDKICRYVPNKSFSKAEKILDEFNYVVISGSPGIGKTTLAEFLIWQYLSKDFELIEISNDIEEAWSILKPDTEKQVFYYDDFLGKTNLTQSYSKNEDKRLIQFIETVLKSKNKKFILTTREYILKEAKLEYEYIDSYPLLKCVIPLQDYTNSIRAKIFYNHLFFTNILPEYIDEILKDKRYMTIIKHPNYNPRIINIFTDRIFLKDTTAETFFKEFLSSLNYPAKIWEHIYNKLNNSEKSILLAIMVSSRPLLPIDKLHGYANAFYENLTKQKLMSSEFKRSMKILDGDFIKIEKKSYYDIETEKVQVQNLVYYTNPSVQDFLENITKQENELDIVLSSLCTYNQFEYFYNTFLKNSSQKKLIIDFINKLRNTVKADFDSPSYSMLLKKTALIIKAIRLSKDMTLFSKIKPEFDYILSANISSTEHDNLFDDLSFLDIDEISEVKDFLYAYKNNILTNIECFTCYYSTVAENLTITNFLENFEDIFNDKEKGFIRNYFIENNEKIAEKILEEDYTEYGFEEQKNKFEELMEYFHLSDEDIGYTLSGLEEAYNELISDYDEDYYKENNDLSSKEKDLTIEQSEDITDNEIIEMFETLKESPSPT